jgi:hypothetical protein
MRDTIIVLLAAGVLGCSGCDPVAVDDSLFPPTAATVLSSGSPTKDEDPSVLRAQDGALYLAWFSDRGNNPDIYVTWTTRGSSWSAPVRVTTSPNGDFAPQLMQDESGVFHLTWFRWSAPNLGNIWYNSSPDGRTWSTANEVRVTNAFNVDDWVPSIVQTADGTLFVYFVSALRDPAAHSDIFFAQKRPGQTSWSAVARVAGINSASEHDHLPFAMRTGNTITLVWVRHDASQALPWLNPKSHVYYATSTDGLTWSAPVRVTNDAGNVVNLFPGLYQEADGTWFLNWLSTRNGAPALFELRLGSIATFPIGLRQNPALPGAGYSHRITATATEGVYLGVWVQGADGVQDIYYRFYSH